MTMVLTKGSRGEVVKRLQAALKVAQDGVFGSITEEAVKAFQKANGLTPDGIVGEKTWKKLIPQEHTLRTSSRVINEIFVHCTATQEGRGVSVAEIRQWHKANGWSDIGYHYVVLLDGSIADGRSVNLVGAHCEGHNAHSIGVVYVGGLDKKGKPKDTRTDKQKASLLKLLKSLKAKYPKAKIYGHCDFSNKACPCFDAKEEYKNL